MISVINDLGKHIEKTYGKRGTPERDKFEDGWEKELDKIYLQQEGTWCEDRINDDDVEYMRVAQVELERTLKQEKIALLKHLVSFSEDMDIPVDAYIRQLINEGEAK